jgi:hypothetical protein
MKVKITTIACATLLLTACATQRYGRATPISDAEKRLLTCEQIDLEIAKNDAFLKQTADQAGKFTGKDVLGFMGDFGIGNSMEYKEAMKSGTDRGAQLSSLRAEKGCSKTLVTPTT